MIWSITVALVLVFPIFSSIRFYPCGSLYLLSLGVKSHKESECVRISLSTSRYFSPSLCCITSLLVQFSNPQSLFITCLYRLITLIQTQKNSMSNQSWNRFSYRSPRWSVDWRSAKWHSMTLLWLRSKDYLCEAGWTSRPSQCNRKVGKFSGPDAQPDTVWVQSPAGGEIKVNNVFCEMLIWLSLILKIEIWLTYLINEFLRSAHLFASTSNLLSIVANNIQRYLVASRGWGC